MTLIDPATSGDEGSGKIAGQASKAGTDFILVGGSTHLTMNEMDRATKRIKEECDTPVIIFPGSSSMFTRYADAIFFMSLLNSSDLDFVVGHQKRASVIVKRSGVESIPMGYLIFDPGMTAGRVGKARLIGKTDYQDAVEYSVAAELMGMKLIYMEAGSGAPYPIPEEMVRRVKEAVGIPVIVGGGIRNSQAASAIAMAGADIIVTGTVAEKSENVYEALKPIIDSIKNIKR
ncbi:MAG: geranylgeranylglyceryl/heptaprenylglyceryl phosphate synthase [Candidatus Thermoplasmatota archaeon]|jgi:phosphoglycerol geranylgeranyltransferase|nr:geranylgeranylglyceryl/heptaprenylglyceryl phosphate synthase [Candidatus Thermoplasmatota archaeon]